MAACHDQFTLCQLRGKKSRIQTRFLYVKQKQKNPVMPMDDEFLMVETCNFVNVRQGVTDMIDLGLLMQTLPMKPNQAQLSI